MYLAVKEGYCVLRSQSPCTNIFIRQYLHAEPTYLPTVSVLVFAFPLLAFASGFTLFSLLPPSLVALTTSSFLGHSLAMNSK